MASWSVEQRARVLALGLALLSGCVTGTGAGAVDGEISAPSCGIDPGTTYSMNPEFFTAESFGEVLTIRVQHAGDDLDYADVLLVTVADTVTLAETQLGQPLAIDDSLASPVRMSFALNDRCPFHDRTSIPVNYGAVSGTITFTSIYTGEGSADRVIDATFSDVRFEDPSDPPTRYAVLDGWFRFTYTRGRPAQLFP